MEPSGPVQACNGTAFLYMQQHNIWVMCSMSVHYIIQKHESPTNAQREFYHQS
jgi:hypothetical protein